jgi:myo-inositol 2-dehydrogenase / D-chiro-inositol 1-dehydrogenase
MTDRPNPGNGRRAPLRIAVLSVVRHGDYMAAAMAAHPDVRVVVVADEPGLPEPWGSRGPDVAAQLDVPFTEDVDAVLARPDVDAVLVTSEYTRHGRLALRVLAAGKHLLVDKPMATSLEECRAIAEAAVEAERRGIRTLTSSGYPAPQVQRAREIIAAGRIGAVRAVRAECVASYGPGEQYDPVADELAWHPRWNGGGEIVNFALYPLSVIRAMTRLEVETVQCFGGALFNRPHRELGIEDMATIVVRFAGGAVGHIVVGRCHTPLHPAPSKYDEGTEIIGTQGIVQVVSDKPALSIYGVPKVGVFQRYLDRDWIPELMDRFVRFARDGVDPGQSAIDSLRVMEVVFAAEESMRTEKTMRL